MTVGREMFITGLVTVGRELFITGFVTFCVNSAILTVLVCVMFTIDALRLLIPSVVTTYIQHTVTVTM